MGPRSHSRGETRFVEFEASSDLSLAGPAPAFFMDFPMHAAAKRFLGPWSNRPGRTALASYANIFMTPPGACIEQEKTMNSPLKKLAAVVLPVVAAAALIGCGPSKTVEQTQYSGFLKEYSKLQPATSPSGTPVMRWISPELSRGNYDKVYFEAPVLYLGKDQHPTAQVSQETMDQIVAYLGSEQKKLLASKMALASGPGPRTLHVRSAITAVRTDKEGLKPYEVVPVALVFAAVNTASGGRDEMTSIFVEGEATDSQTGELLAQFVRKDAGPSLENETTRLTLKDVQPVLDKWNKEFYAQLKNYTNVP